MEQKPNLFYIVSDTLRTAYLGCYGSEFIRTPNLDAFAAESLVFDSAYPESLPTIPVRRALHTGRRAFPFRDYEPVRWDNVYLPGWQPMANQEDNLAENLVRLGYYTGFVSDVPHYFVPGMNFTRGAWQWEFIRGQAEDKWRSPATASDAELCKYGDPEEIKRGFPGGRPLRHVANYAHIRSEEDTTTARIFRWAMDFVEDNRNAQPVYCMIDCFVPHESWEAPQSYLEMYADADYDGLTYLSTVYGPGAEVYTPEETRHIKAHYCGLVSLFDAWFGHFITKLKRLGLFENSLIVFLSDHGTNFIDNPEDVIGKPHYSLYPGVMHIPLMVHFPGGAGAGRRVDDLVYNLDGTATMYDYAGVALDTLSLDGQSLGSFVRDGQWNEREYLTSRYGDTVWYRDREHWVIIDVKGKPRAAFELRSDPDCQRNVVSESDAVVANAWERILADAGGDLPIYDMKQKTDAVGRVR